MSVRADWRLHAACRDADPELFFPISTSGPGRRQAEQAKRVCGTCPAQPECLAWALDHGVTDGVWGGTTADQRRASGSCQLAGTPEPPTHAPARPPGVRHGSQPPGGFARTPR
jgi:WhiB family redox-sensing transcriptional regulator